MHKVLHQPVPVTSSSHALAQGAATFSKHRCIANAVRTDHGHAKALGVVHVKVDPRHRGRVKFEALHGGIGCRIVSRPYVEHTLVVKRADAAVLAPTSLSVKSPQFR